MAAESQSSRGCGEPDATGWAGGLPCTRGAHERLGPRGPVVCREAQRVPRTAFHLEWLFRNGWRFCWQSVYFCGAGDFRKNLRYSFGDTVEVNAMTVPADEIRPGDLPETHRADEDRQRRHAALC